MNSISDFLLFLAFCSSAYSTFVFITLGKFKKQRVFKSGTKAVIVTTVFTIIPFISLYFALLDNNFSLKIVANSQKDYTVIYKFCVLLFTNSGFLLMWAICNSVVALYISIKKRNILTQTSYCCLLIFSILSTFLLFVLNFNLSPFLTVDTIPFDGKGLYPSLHFPNLLIVHTLSLIVGYVGITYIFAESIGRMIDSNRNEKNTENLRIHTLLAWIFLLINLISGCRWAYLVEGFGGVWSFDIIQNISLLPILFSTAYLHSIIIEEKKGMLKIWNISLIVLTFHSVLFTAYVVRSPFYKTSHFFSHSASSSSFLVLCIMSLFVTAIIIFLNSKSLKGKYSLEAALSRESSFLINNLLFLSFSFIIFWGIILPKISLTFGIKINIGPGYFKEMIVPIGISLLILTGICPMLAWRKTTLKKFLKSISIPAIFSIIFPIILYKIFHITKPQIIAASTASVFVVISTIYDTFLCLNINYQNKEKKSKIKILKKQHRKFAGYLIHIGIAVLVLGLCGNTYSREKRVEINQGEYVSFEDYKILYDKIEDNYEIINSRYVLAINLIVKKGNRLIGILKPQMTFNRGYNPTNKVSIFSSLKEDLYISWHRYSTSSGSATITISIKPFIKLIWIGSFIMFLGTFIAVIPLKRKIDLKISKNVTITGLIFIAFFTLSKKAYSSSENPEKNTIQGKVVIENPGEYTPVPNLDLVLNSHAKGTTKIVTSKTDDEGNFKFEVEKERASYFITVKYKTVTYGSDILTFDERINEDTKTISISVFETTNNIKDIKISEHFVVIDPDFNNRTFFIKEIMKISNETGKIYLGSKKLYHDKYEVLRILLPEGFSNLEYISGLNTNSSYLNNWGVLDTTPIKPGLERKIEFTYSYDMKDKKSTLSWVPYLDTDKFSVLLKSTGLTETSDTLEFFSIEDIKKLLYKPKMAQDKNKDKKTKKTKTIYYKVLEKRDLKASKPLDITIDTEKKENINLKPLAGFVFTILAFTVVVLRKKE